VSCIDREQQHIEISYRDAERTERQVQQNLSVAKDKRSQDNNLPSDGGTPRKGVARVKGPA
jgi:hypothetical protein